MFKELLTAKLSRDREKALKSIKKVASINETNPEKRGQDSAPIHHIRIRY